MSMPDALTESFCERCGTRYEFAAPTELTTIRRARGVLSGLKNYIMSQDSLSDAVGDGIRSQEEVLASAQLDAFHSSFNFCIDCRQYACTNCWNELAGRCQSCQPLPDAMPLADRFAANLAHVHAGEVGAQFPLDEQTAWPASDLPEAEPEPVWVEPEPEPEPMPLEPAPMLAEVAEVAEPEPEPVLAEVPEPEPEPVLAEPEPIPHRPLRPISDTLLRVPRAMPDQGEAIAAAEANDESLAARRAQLDELGLGEAEQGPIGRTRPVLLPYRSSGAAPHPADAQAAVAGPAFWDASAREVAGAVTQIGVRSCGHCELSISATARFCRRCGTPQAQSA